MNDVEERISALLHASAPTPPKLNAAAITAPARAGASPHRWLAPVGMGIAVLLLVLVPTVVVSRAHHDRSGAAAPAAAPDPDAAKIISIATGAARTNGDAAPTAIQWVRASRGAIANLIGFGVPADQQNAEEILILVTGSFTATNAKHPANYSAAPPTGRNLEIVVDPSTWSTTDSGIGNFDIKLSTIGVVHTR